MERHHQQESSHLAGNSPTPLTRKSYQTQSLSRNTPTEFLRNTSFPPLNFIGARKKLAPARNMRGAYARPRYRSGEKEICSAFQPKILHACGLRNFTRNE